MRNSAHGGWARGRADLTPSFPLSAGGGSRRLGVRCERAGRVASANHTNLHEGYYFRRGGALTSPPRSPSPRAERGKPKAGGEVRRAGGIRESHESARRVLFPSRGVLTSPPRSPSPRAERGKPQAGGEVRRAGRVASANHTNLHECNSPEGALPPQRGGSAPRGHTRTRFLRRFASFAVQTPLTLALSQRARGRAARAAFDRARVS